MREMSLMRTPCIRIGTTMISISKNNNVHSSRGRERLYNDKTARGRKIIHSETETYASVLIIRETKSVINPFPAK